VGNETSERGYPWGCVNVFAVFCSVHDGFSDVAILCSSSNRFWAFLVDFVTTLSCSGGFIHEQVWSADMCAWTNDYTTFQADGTFSVLSQPNDTVVCRFWDSHCCL